jgi:hypothetical protein
VRLKGKPVDWIIYYSDGSTFSSDDGAWTDAPAWDVQVVLFYHPINGWYMRHNADFYRLATDNTVIGMDFVGMLDHVLNIHGDVKAGRMLSQVKFANVYQQAKADMAELKGKPD